MTTPTTGAAPRPTCPTCGVGIERLQAAMPTSPKVRPGVPTAPGIWAPYPCGHWLTQQQARDVAQRAKALRDAA